MAAGRVAVCVSTFEPLFAMVTQVLLPALVCKQVRAVTRYGASQPVSRAIFDMFATVMHGSKEAADDGSYQVVSIPGFGRIMVVHPDQDGTSLRWGLTLTGQPDAVLATASVQMARQISSQIRGCPVLVPQPLGTCAVAGPQAPTALGATVQTIASSFGAHAHRLGGAVGTLMLHDAVIAPFMKLLPEAIDKNICMQVRDISDYDGVGDFCGQEENLFNEALPTLRIYRYIHDEELSRFLQEVSGEPIHLSLFGVSPLTLRTVPRHRLHLGRLPVESDNLARSAGHATLMGQAWVAPRFLRIAPFDLLETLHKLMIIQTMSTTDAPGPPAHAGILHARAAR